MLQILYSLQTCLNSEFSKTVRQGNNFIALALLTSPSAIGKLHFIKYSRLHGAFLLSCFHDYFQLKSSVHRIGTRQATRGDLFKSIKNTTLYGLQTIQYFGSKLWNTLPLFIRVASSIAVFRSKLKSYFLDSYSQN